MSSGGDAVSGRQENPGHPHLRAGNGAPIGGLKVIAESGWFAARPSGAESICEIYVGSFRGSDHLRRILEEAQAIVSETLAAMPDPRENS